LRSRKATLKGKPRTIVDTSFLLPAVGIETDPEVYDAIKLFHRYEVMYLEVSILEIMWKILKVVSPREIERIIDGLKAIFETYTSISPPAEAYADAYHLYHEGHGDFIDNLIYSTSRRVNANLLTLDLKFVRFLREKGYPTENVLTPADLTRNAY